MGNSFLKVKSFFNVWVVPQLWMQLGRSGLPSETLKSGLSEGGVSAGSAKGIVLKASTLLPIFQRCRFKFSLERPPRPWE